MFFLSRCVQASLLSVIDMSWNGVDARAAGRSFHALSFRLDGEAVLFCENHAPVQAPEGSVCLCPAHCDFLKKAGPGRIIAVHFLSSSPLPEEIRCFRPHNPERFRMHFSELYRVWTEKQFGYEYAAQILFARILLEIEREWAEGRPTLSNEKLAKACRYLHEHITDNALSEQTLCRICGMSDTYFRALFREEFGQTPAQYRNRLRLQMAVDLLESGYYTVGEVADRCGFGSVQYFSAFVKRESGQPPLFFRRRANGTASLSRLLPKDAAAVSAE